MSETEHERADKLLPWLVNGRLQAEELAWLNSHLEHCAECRNELIAQQRVRAAVIAQPTVEYAPQSSFNRLWARIDADAFVPLPDQPLVLPPAQRHFWRWMAAGIAAQLLLFATLWFSRALVPDSTSAGTPPAEYQTVTSSSSPATPAARLQVVFDDAVTVAEVKVILGRAGLTTQNGPTPAGVYTLVLDAEHAGAPIGTALATLRLDPRVRFVAPSNDP
jgi:anti-sigma factor RsiW